MAWPPCHSDEIKGEPGTRYIMYNVPRLIYAALTFFRYMHQQEIERRQVAFAFWPVLGSRGASGTCSVLYTDPYEVGVGVQ